MMEGGDKMFGVSADGDGVGLHYKTQSSLDEMLEYHPQEQQQQTTASRREREKSNWVFRYAISLSS